VDDVTTHQISFLQKHLFGPGGEGTGADLWTLCVQHDSTHVHLSSIGGVVNDRAGAQVPHPQIGFIICCMGEVDPHDAHARIHHVREGGEVL